MPKVMNHDSAEMIHHLRKRQWQIAYLKCRILIRDLFAWTWSGLSNIFMNVCGCVWVSCSDLSAVPMFRTFKGMQLLCPPGFVGSDESTSLRPCSDAADEKRSTQGQRRRSSDSLGHEKKKKKAHVFGRATLLQRDLGHWVQLNSQNNTASTLSFCFFSNTPITYHLQYTKIRPTFRKRNMFYREEDMVFEKIYVRLE